MNIRGEKAVIILVYAQKGRLMKASRSSTIQDTKASTKTCDFNGKTGFLGGIHPVGCGLPDRVFVMAFLIFLVVIGPGAAIKADYALDGPIVITQLPVGTAAEREGSDSGGMLRADYGDGARLIVLQPDSARRVLSEGFDSACDPAVSFDGKRIVFSGKKKAGEKWNVFEIAVDGSGLRQVTEGTLDCRNPGYQAELYTIVSAEPWYQLTFVGYEKGAVNEYGGEAAGSLYSCKLDGSDVRRLTFNLSSDMDPFIQPDGRLLFAGWQRSGMKRGLRGRVSLFGINIDGTDFAAFSTDEGMRIKHTPCMTTQGVVVFVEGESVGWDGAGTLGSVSFRRPLHSYRPIAKKSAGLFHSPWPLSDGSILVSRRSVNGGDTHGVGRLEISTGKFEAVFDDPAYHDIQAKAIYPRSEPDGRSSVVSLSDPNGKLYCLDIGISDVEMPKGTAQRLRVIEGIARTINSHAAESENGIPSLAARRILGEVPIEKDGSFNIEIPANTPIELQTLDGDGMALRTCAWIWAKNHEPRGCIGCHEDGELTPDNYMVDAVMRPSHKLTLPPESRRTVDFRNDVMPIISKKCVGCHDKPDSPVRFSADMSAGKSGVSVSYTNLLAGADKGGMGKYVDPGRARTSRLIWHIFGKNTSRSWDGLESKGAVKQMPPSQSGSLTKDERRIFVEWIDLGAMWDGSSLRAGAAGNVNKAKGGDK